MRHVAASLEGISAIVENGIPCDHAVLLTGQDFPVKSNEEIKARLDRNHGWSFLSYFPVPDNDEWLPDGGLDRIDRWHFWVRGRRLQLPSEDGQGRLGSALRLVNGVVPRRRFLPGLRPYGGSSYWCLSGEAVAFVHRYIRDHPEFVSFFRRVFIPDELFFQTVNDKGATIDAGSIRRAGDVAPGKDVTTQPVVPQTKPSPVQPGPDKPKP